jgi:hypothetical protein
VAHGITAPPSFEIHLRELYDAALGMSEDRIMAALARILPSYSPSRGTVVPSAKERVPEPVPSPTAIAPAMAHAMAAGDR